MPSAHKKVIEPKTVSLKRLRKEIRKVLREPVSVTITPDMLYFRPLVPFRKQEDIAGHS